MPEEFVSFEYAMRELRLTSDQLKELVSEGTLQAIRSEHNAMRFRKDTIDRLKQNMPKESDYVSFEAALPYLKERGLTITADQLKRLVSEGMIRAIRAEHNKMKFRKDELERVANTPPTELEEILNPKLPVDDLLFDETDER